MYKTLNSYNFYLKSSVYHIYISIPSDGEYGVKLANGSWAGIMGLVIRSEVDLTVGGMPLFEEYCDAVNVSYPYPLTEIIFMRDKLKPVSKSIAVFLPFSSKLWISLAAIILFFISLIPSNEEKAKLSLCLIHSIWSFFRKIYPH